MRESTDNSSNSVTLFAILAATGALAVASTYGTIERDLFVQLISKWTGLGIALAAHGSALFIVAFLGIIMAILLWKYRARHGVSATAGVFFIVSACIAFYETINAISFGVVSKDLYRTGIAAESSEDATMKMVEPRTVSIVGPIGPNLMKEFNRFNELFGPIDTIEITSEGGLIDQALLLANHAESRQLRVVVRKECQSACILIAVASKNSFAEEDAVFGFHLVYPIVEVSTEIAMFGVEQTNKESFEFLRRHGVSESILTEAMKHGEDTVYEVSAKEMIRSGAIKGLAPNEQ